LCGLALEARTALAASLLLNDERSLTDAGTTYELLDLDLHEIATPKLAVDRKVEERAITEAMLLLQEEAHRPNLLWQEWPLGAKLSANIPTQGGLPDRDRRSHVPCIVSSSQQRPRRKLEQRLGLVESGTAALG
jgi:hypothetical protein